MSLLSAPIAGPRVVLRSLTCADVTDAYIGWLNDPAVTRYLEVRWSRHGADDVAAFVAAMNDSSDQYLMGIFLRDAGTHIGNIKIGPIRPIHATADVSLFIGAKDMWGKGYASEAIALASDHGTGPLAIRKLNAGVYAPNAGSVGAFLKAGWWREGLRKAQFRSDDSICDEVLLGFARDGAGTEGASA